MKKKTLKKMIQWIVLIYVLVIVGIYALQKYIIFQPVELAAEYKFVFENSYDEFFIKTVDDATLNVLLFQTDLPRKGLVLYFHGNADNLQRWGKFHSDFTSRGYDILMPDFRGFGKSTGEPDELKFYQDAQLIYNWIFENLEKYKKNEVIIYGRSLGCAIASNLATKVETQKVILETPFKNINNLMKTNGRIIFLPFDFKYNFPNDEHLMKIQKPIYIFAGTKDLVVPNKSTEQLRPLLKPSDQYIEIEGGGHKNLSTFKQYQQALDSIL